MERKATVRNYASATWNSTIFTNGGASRPAAAQQRKCLGCAFLNAAGTKICARCASRMCNPCPACGKVMDLGYACYGCGYQEPRTSGSPLWQQPPPAGTEPAPARRARSRKSVPMPAARQAASKAAREGTAGVRWEADEPRRKRRRTASAACRSASGGRQKAGSQPAAASHAGREEDVIDLSQGADDGTVHSDEADFINVDDDAEEEDGSRDEATFPGKTTAAADRKSGVYGRDSSRDSVESMSRQERRRVRQAKQHESVGSPRDADQEDPNVDEFAEAWAEAGAEAQARNQSACSTCTCLCCGKGRYTNAACAHCGYKPRQDEAESPSSDTASLSPRSLRRRRERERAAARAAGLPATPPPVYEILSDSSDVEDVEDAAPVRKQPRPRERGGAQPANAPRGRADSSYDLTGSNSDDAGDIGCDPIPEFDDDEDCELELI